MGSVGSAVGGITGATTGFGLAGPAGALLGGSLGSSIGGGNFNLGNALGINNGYGIGMPEIQMQPELLKQIQAAQAGMNPINQGQNQLAQALLAQSQGQGPNPAQMMMRQAQDRANMQGAGMLASAKGVNPALAARQAAQNTMMGNQQNAQQAGILGAQQQLAAQQQLGGMYGQMGNQNLGQQQLLQQALANQNNAYTNASLGASGINAGVASGNAQRNAGLIGGLIGGAGSLLGMGIGKGGGAKGGGGTPGNYAGPDSFGDGSTLMASHGAYIGGEAPVDGDSPKNDIVPAMLSPGEIVIPRSQTKDIESAKAFVEHLMKQKGKKAKA